MKLNALSQLSKELTVLYVEDHEETRVELQELLETIFPIVYVATNGEEGLEYYRNNPIDLIITDINMPIMDGLEMIETIRNSNDQIKIIVFSAHEKVEYLLQSIELGVDGFLSKPFNQKKYFKTLFKVVEQIQDKKELNAYKENLEKKVQEQLNELVEKNNMLEKNAKLATMGEMIDAIAHQWKSPLSVLKLLIDVNKMNIQNNILDPKDIDETMDKMNLQINHLYETIEEFRKFFRPNTQLETIPVKSLIDSTLLLLKDELMQYPINVHCEYENEDITFTVNKNEFIHILINLIQNSKDAFLQNEIAKKNIYIRVFQDKETIYLEICDNAGGIPEESLDDVFTPHFTTKEADGGTGIGLYLVKQILDKINAKIRVHNKNDGACFTISTQEKIYCEI